tara:strand:+ start:1429 stop:1695 length:267 start_codon:yes stop_codon:yes gene_type:complete
MGYTEKWRLNARDLEEEIMEKETYYLVQYVYIDGDREFEGVFTKESWKKYIREVNKERLEDGEQPYNERLGLAGENEEFLAIQIRVYN